MAVTIGSIGPYLESEDFETQSEKYVKLSSEISYIMTRDVPDIRLLSGYPAIRPFFHYPVSGYPVSGHGEDIRPDSRISSCYPAGYRIIRNICYKIYYRTIVYLVYKFINFSKNFVNIIMTFN